MKKYLPVYRLSSIGFKLNHFSILSIFFLLFFVKNNAIAQCSIVIDKITVSGCYQKAGQSKATVSAEISWVNPPTATSVVTVSINPSTGTATPTSRTFQVGVNSFNYGSFTGSQKIVSPQVIAFEIDANAATGTITAQFNGTCTTTSTYTAPAACPITVCSSGGFGGLVFYDYNANGNREVTTATISGQTVTSGEVEGPAGVTITVIDNNGNTYSTVSDAYGAYSFSQTLVYPIRVEYTNIPTEFLGSSTPQGTANGSTVQFFSAATCTAYLGVNRLSDYCNTSPRIFTSCYVNGDPLKGGTAGTDYTMVSVPLAADGKSITASAVGAGNSYWSIGSQTGAVWGIAFNRKTKKIFTSAVLRRHVGFGPQGIGGIYLINASTNAPTSATAHTSTFLDLDAAPFNQVLGTGGLGSGTASSTANAGRPDLPADKGIATATAAGASRDPLAFSRVVKEGLGDLELSDNYDTLFTINLNTKKLLKIDLTTYNLNGTLPTSLQEITLPNPGCINGEFRPWALSYHHGALYVGGVCDGSNTAATLDERKSSLRAYIYKYENGVFSTTPVLDFPLSYPKGYPFSSFVNITGWYPWTDNFADFVGATNALSLVYPVPFLADIEFDTDGSMILGLGDRLGMQTGVANFDPTAAYGNNLFTAFSGGDILKAYAKNGVFILENNAQAGPFKGYGSNNRQGPGFGEYFNDDWSFGSTQFHAEAGLGGLAIRPGSGQTIAASIDPQDGTAWAGGFRILNNNTGLLDDAYSVYGTTTGGLDPAAGNLGKAAGIGDIELTCDFPNYLEVGNRAWNDVNKNGIQDPSEPALVGVTIRLYDEFGVAVPGATAITNAKGEFTFAAAAGINTTSSIYNLPILPNKQYELRMTALGSNASTSGFTLNDVSPLTPGESGTVNTGTTLSNNDAKLVGGFPSITFTTGNVGENNHTFDFAMTCLNPPLITNIQYTQGTCPSPPSIVTNNNATIVVSTDGSRAAISTTGTPTTSFAAATSVVSNTITFSGLDGSADSLYIRVYLSEFCLKDTMLIVTPTQGCNQCEMDTLILSAGNCKLPTSTYDLSGTVSFINAPLTGTLTILSGSVSTVINAPFTSPVAFTLTNMPSDSALDVVTAVFSADTNCIIQSSVMAPVACQCPDPNCFGITVTEN